MENIFSNYEKQTFNWTKKAASLCQINETDITTLGDSTQETTLNLPLWYANTEDEVFKQPDMLLEFMEDTGDEATQYYLVQFQDSIYLVNTEGYDYARYITELKNVELTDGEPTIKEQGVIIKMTNGDWITAIETTCGQLRYTLNNSQDTFIQVKTAQGAITINKQQIITFK